MPSKKQIEKALHKEKEIQALEEKMRENESWEVGTNKRAQIKEEKINHQQEEKMRKNRELKELIEQDNISTNQIPRPKTSRGKKNDLHLLNESLANIPKTKGQKESERKNKEREDRKFEELKRQKEKEEQRKEEEKQTYLLKQRNIVQSKLTIDTRNLEPIQENSIYATGIDDVLDVIDNNQIKQSKKAAYKEFYERNLPILKMEMPHLRLSQYEDKIQKMWRISFDNPNNMC